MGCSLPGSSVHGDSPGKNTGVNYHSLLQGIFPTQESNPGLLHCRQIPYHLSHQGSPRHPSYLQLLHDGVSHMKRTHREISGRKQIQMSLLVHSGVQRMGGVTCFFLHISLLPKFSTVSGSVSFIRMKSTWRKSVQHQAAPTPLACSPSGSHHSPQ